MRGGNSDDESREGEKKKPKTEQEVAAEKKQQELEAEAIDKFNEILWQGRDHYEECDLISPERIDEYEAKLDLRNVEKRLAAGRLSALGAAKALLAASDDPSRHKPPATLEVPCI